MTVNNFVHSAWRALLPAMATAMALCGCVAYSPSGLPPGADEALAVQRMGTPSGRYVLPAGGERLEFRRGPFGRHTFMLDFDASRHLVTSTQVLTETFFDAVRVGQTRDELLQRIGHPGGVIRIGFQQRDLWSYRYDTPMCRLFQVGIDDSGTVVDVGYGIDPSCDPLDS